MSKRVSLKSQILAWAATAPIGDVDELMGTLREVVRQRVPRQRKSKPVMKDQGAEVLATRL